MLPGSDVEDDPLDDDQDKGGTADALLRDFRYRVQCQFMEADRALRASGLMKKTLGPVISMRFCSWKNFTVSFQGETHYPCLQAIVVLWYS